MFFRIVFEKSSSIFTYAILSIVSLPFSSLYLFYEYLPYPYNSSCAVPFSNAQNPLGAIPVKPKTRDAIARKIR